MSRGERCAKCQKARTREAHCSNCDRLFSPFYERSFCSRCIIDLREKEGVEKELREELIKVKTELQRVRRTSSFLQAWDEGMFVAPVADVWLKTTDKTFAALGAHRCVLASKSSVFKAMLFNDTRERATGLVEIADVSPDVLQALIIFLYKGDVKDDCLAVKAQPLLEAAIKYDIQGLTELCIQYIIHNDVPRAPYDDSKLDHVICLLQLALKYNLADVKGAVVEQLARSGSAIGSRELQMLLACDRFRSLKETDPLQSVEICECIIGYARSEKQSVRRIL